MLLLLLRSPAAAGTFDTGIFDTAIFDNAVGGGGSAQSLTPTLFADGDSFGAATVAAGAVTLTTTRYVDADTFGAATVSPGAVTLTATAVTDADTFGAASIGFTLVATTYSNASTFGAASVGYTLTATLYSETDIFGSATVTAGAVTLTPTLFSDGDSFGAATVTLGGAPAQNLSATLYADGDTFGAPTATVGAVTLTPAAYANVSTFGAAVVSGGEVISLRRGDDAPPSARERFWRAKAEEWLEGYLERLPRPRKAKQAAKLAKVFEAQAAEYLAAVPEIAPRVDAIAQMLELLTVPQPDYTALAMAVAAEMEILAADRRARRRKRDVEAILMLAA